MSSGMNTEQAKEYAKTMTYSEAVSNVKYSKGIKYRKATMIKLRELAEIADRLDKADTPQTELKGSKRLVKGSNGETESERLDRIDNEIEDALARIGELTPQTEEVIK